MHPVLYYCNTTLLLRFPFILQIHRVRWRTFQQCLYLWCVSGKLNQVVWCSANRESLQFATVRFPVNVNGSLLAKWFKKHVGLFSLACLFFLVSGHRPSSVWCNSLWLCDALLCLRQCSLTHWEAEVSGGAVRFLVVGTIGKEERPPRDQLWMEQYLISPKYGPIWYTIWADPNYIWGLASLSDFFFFVQ